MNLREVRKTYWQRLGTSLDQAITAVSPRWAMRRMQERTAMQMLSAYRGATHDRLRKHWVPGGGSADDDLLPDLPALRERSRDLNRNDAFGSAITNTVVANTVGTGIRPQPSMDLEATGMSEAQGQAFERAALKVWRQWCPYADAQNRMDFYEMQALVKRQIVENGEVFLIPLRITDEPWRPYNLAFEVIEADRVETPPNKSTDPRVRDGVELGVRGQPVAYYVRKHHPGDMRVGHSIPPSWVRYPAVNVDGRANIFHLYHVKRPGQTRGEPFFAPVLAHFKDLADYLEAELVANRVAACFSAFIKRNDPYAAMTAAGETVNERGQRIQEFEPGMVAYLQPGEEISFATPNRPGNTFEPFVMMALRAIGASLGLPIELVLKDFSRTNYSSARAALLEGRRFFKNYQQWLAVRLCQPAWNLLLEEAWLREKVPAVNLFGEDGAEFFRVRWIAPGWGWVDPVKEVESSDMAIKASLSTLAEECASQGRDWEEVLEQRRREAMKMDELGLTPAPAPSPAPVPDREMPPAPEEGQDPDTDTTKEEEPVGTIPGEP